MKKSEVRSQKSDYFSLSSVICYLSSVLCFLFSALCLLSSVVWAYDVEIKTTVDKDTITIGDPVKYTISIAADKKSTVKMPGEKINVYPFEILSYAFTEAEGFINMEYTISAYRLGEFDIPSIEIIYIDESGIEKRIATEKQKIKVKSILPEDAKDLKDIKGPLSLKIRKEKGEQGRNTLFLIFTLFILFCFAIFFAVMILRKKKKAVDAPRPLSPSDIALKELEGITALSLFEKGEVKKLYILIADAIRHFITARFCIDAVKRTSGEIVRELRGIHTLNGQVELIYELLHDCDIVKFSKYNPTKEEARSIVRKAEEIIQRTVGSKE